MFISDTLESSVPSTSTTGDSWTNLKCLIRTLERAGNTVSRVKDSLEEFLQLTEVYERFESTWNEYEAMKRELEKIFIQLSENCAEITRLRTTGCIEGLCRDIRIELAYIRHYSVVQQNDEDSVRGGGSSKLLARYRRIQVLLRGLLLNTDPGTWDALDKDPGLSLLSYSSGSYDPVQGVTRDSCFPPAEVRRLREWVQNSPPGAVCWVRNTRQTGLSHSLCAELDATHKLGASFFSPENLDHNSIIPSLACQLADYSIPFRLALPSPGLQALSESLDVQFQELIAGPLTNVRETLPFDLAVVIDAHNGTKSILPILDAILAKSRDLPIKFFIFSRPESYHDSVGLFLHEASREYVIEGLEGELNSALTSLGLPELHLAHLVQRAGVLITCAAVAARYIGDDNSWLKSSTL